MAKFIRFDKTDEFFNGRELFRIVNKRSGNPIGQIFFYKPWGIWCARFSEDSVWSEDCLDDVRAFIKERQSGKGAK